MSSTLPILLDPNPLLHQKAKVFGVIDDGVKELVASMIATVREQGMGGVGGLAAPQVGVLQQVFVLVLPDVEPQVVINPRVLREFGGTSKAWEYCYSIPGKRGRIKRYKKAEIAWLDLDGKEHSEELSGFVARMYLHEIDHLNGVLWTDRVENGPGSSPGDVMSEVEWEELKHKTKNIK